MRNLHPALYLLATAMLLAVTVIVLRQHYHRLADEHNRNFQRQLAEANLACQAGPAAGCRDAAARGKPSGKQAGVRKSAKKARTGAPRAYPGDFPSLARVNMRNAVAETVYTGLRRPWAMEFLNPGQLLINQFEGEVILLDLDAGTQREIPGLQGIASDKGQVGLMDLALHPHFSDNGLVYFSHAVRDPDDPQRFATALSRARFDGERLLDQQRLFTALPYLPSKSNFGGALEFDDQGYLYLGVGDRSREHQAQSMDNSNGKILRLTDRGEPAPGNPWAGDGDPARYFYAIGVRNPQGLAFDRDTGRLYESEHGPMGGDEINLISAGANYGWPTISYGQAYDTQSKGIGTRAAGLEQPLFYYLPSIATSPIALYQGDMFPEWQGDLLVGPLKPGHINKLDIVDGQVRSEHRLLSEISSRTRDIKVAEDGSIYILSGSNGTLFRLYRDPLNPELQQPEQRSGKLVFNIACAGCHDSGSPHIPQLSRSGDWQRARTWSRDELLQQVIDGFGAMPPRGLCDICTEEELQRAIDYLLDAANPETVPDGEAAGAGARR